MGFEVHSLNNNKINSLANPSYSVHICCVATDSNVIAVGYGRMSQTQPPVLSWDCPQDSVWCPQFHCLQPFPTMSLSLCLKWLPVIAGLLLVCPHPPGSIILLSFPSSFCTTTPEDQPFLSKAKAANLRLYKTELSVVPGLGWFIWVLVAQLFVTPWAVAPGSSV